MNVMKHCYSLGVGSWLKKKPVVDVPMDRKKFDLNKMLELMMCSC